MKAVWEGDGLGTSHCIAYHIMPDRFQGPEGVNYVSVVKGKRLFAKPLCTAERIFIRCRFFSNKNCLQNLTGLSKNIGLHCFSAAMK